MQVRKKRKVEVYVVNWIGMAATIPEGEAPEEEPAPVSREEARDSTEVAAEEEPPADFSASTGAEGDSRSARSVRSGQCRR